MEIVITFERAAPRGPPSFNKDGSACPPAMSRHQDDRDSVLRTKLLAQITDRVTVSSRLASGDCRPKPHAMANKKRSCSNIYSRCVLRLVERRSVDFCHLTGDDQHRSVPSFVVLRRLARDRRGTPFLIDEYQNHREEPEGPRHLPLKTEGGIEERRVANEPSRYFSPDNLLSARKSAGQHYDDALIKLLLILQGNKSQNLTVSSIKEST